MTDKVHDGTPNYSRPSLCFDCTKAHVFRGHGVSSLRVRCQAAYEDPIEIKDVITTCSDHQSRNSQDLHELKKIGYVLETRKGKPIGFVSPAEFKKHVTDGIVDGNKDDDY